MPGSFESLGKMVFLGVAGIIIAIALMVATEIALGIDPLPASGWLVVGYAFAVAGLHFGGDGR